jgi:hypothetical protein
MPMQTARQKEAEHAMTHIRDPIQELLIIVRRNQILGAVTNIFAEKGDHSNQEGKQIVWNGLVCEKNVEQLFLDESQGHLPPTKHDAPLCEIH